MDETLPYLTSVIEVEGGHDFSCARKSDGSVYCWGSDGWGQLGTSSFSLDSPIARQVFDLDDASDFCVGYQHACAVKSNGKMVCWGNGADDRLGFGNSLNQQSPVEVKNINTAVSCSLGHDHSCVKLSDKTNRCWGSANSGQLGNGQLDSNKMTIPVTVKGINTAIQISVGDGHSCAVLEGGTVSCWGNGLQGQLGIGVVGTRMNPTNVPITGTATQVSAGSNHTCILKSDGTVWCFGENGLGQLGNGSNIDSFTPVQANITSVTQISSGSSYTCARTQSAKVYCWGHGSEGMTGLGNRLSISTPTEVSGLSNVSSVETMYNHPCAKFDNGTLSCWGDSNYHQLGTRQYNYNDVVSPQTVLGSYQFLE